MPLFSYVFLYPDKGKFENSMHFNTFLKDPVKKGCFQLDSPGHPFHSMDHVHSRASWPQAVSASAEAEDANDSKDSKIWLDMSETLRLTTAQTAYYPLVI